MTPATALCVDLVAASAAARGVCTLATRGHRPQVAVTFDTLEQAQAFNALFLAAREQLRAEAEQDTLARLALFGLVMAVALR